jgi:hypothetical protein
MCVGEAEVSFLGVKTKKPTENSVGYFRYGGDAGI